MLDQIKDLGVDGIKGFRQIFLPKAVFSASIMPKTMPQPEGHWQTFSRLEAKLHVDPQIAAIWRLFCLTIFGVKRVAPLRHGVV
jgi:hypothetical protein